MTVYSHCTWLEANDRKRNWKAKGKHQKLLQRHSKGVQSLPEEVLRVGIKQRNCLQREGVIMKEMNVYAVEQKTRSLRGVSGGSNTWWLFALLLFSFPYYWLL